MANILPSITELSVEAAEMLIFPKEQELTVA